MSTESEHNHYQLFGLPVRFRVNEARLSRRYRDLRQQLETDASLGEAEREQRAARLNEAYLTLQDPLLRARYLLGLEGVEVGTAAGPPDEALLMEQTELSAALADARRSDNPEAALMHLLQDVDQRVRDTVLELDRLFARGSAEALGEAAQAVRRLGFLDSLRAEAEALEDTIALTSGE